MDPNQPNRLYLNFGSNIERLMPSDRTLLTTSPSFPQSDPTQHPSSKPGIANPTSPQFQSVGNFQIQKPYVSQQAQQQQQQLLLPAFSPNLVPSNHFSPPTYQSRFAGDDCTSQNSAYQPPQSSQATSAVTSPALVSPSTSSPSSLASPSSNDPNTSLAYQFSHQNLGAGAGAAVRSPPYSASRGASPVVGPPAAFKPSPRLHSSNPGQPFTTTSNIMTVPVSANGSASSTPEAVFQQAPERNSDKYGPNAAVNNQKKCSQLSTDFFKDNVKRARERNQRQADLEEKLADTSLSDAKRDHLWSTHGRKEGQYLRFLRTRDKPSNYTTVKIIGKGAFGEVKLVQKKSDGKVYAMKSLIKSEMFRRDQLAHVRSERDILAESDSPWVVKLYTTFQDTYFLYMLMEFLPGGDLMTMLIKYEIFSEDITRFYMAEIVLAIEAVHKLGFIHRDIKPDNILLDRGGHVKLTDFGLSTGFHRMHDNNYYQQLLQGRPNRSRGDRNSIAIDQINLTVSNRSQINDWRRSRRLLAYSTVGTPDYIAPEIFTRTGYSYDCDWWSLGTIMFECLVGWPPFCAEDSSETYRKILNWPQTLYFPEEVVLGAEAENLMRSLVCNCEQRLGRRGVQEIKDHPFFRGVDFKNLRRIRAPFEPRLTSNIDTTYFPIDEIDQTDNASLLRAQAAQQGRHPDETPEMSLPFIGYTFKRFDNNFR